MSLSLRHRETFLLHLLSHLCCLAAASWKLQLADQTLPEQITLTQAEERCRALTPSSAVCGHHTSPSLLVGMFIP